MPGMKRFVTYIYLYEDKKKGSNAGFAKVEIRGEDCRIEIHLRGVCSGVKKGSVCLFRTNAGDMIGFAMGEMQIMNGSGDFGTIIKAGEIGNSPYSIYEMEGLCIIGDDGQMMVSRWKEGIALEVDRKRFKLWQPPQLAEISAPLASEPKLQEKNQPSTPGKQPQKQPSGEVKPPETQSSEMREQKIHQNYANIEEQENISATEIPMRNIFPKYDWLTIWERLQKEHTVFAPFEDKEILCVQIELKNLRELPKRYWYLGNNSFLLHGFFNYRYIIIGNIDKDRWFIGVPGVYQHQERVMAAIFGFPEFIPASETGGENGAKEVSEPLNRFGYWYRFIEE